MPPFWPKLTDTEIDLIRASQMPACHIFVHYCNFEIKKSKSQDHNNVDDDADADDDGDDDVIVIVIVNTTIYIAPSVASYF